MLYFSISCLANYSTHPPLYSTIHYKFGSVSVSVPNNFPRPPLSSSSTTSTSKALGAESAEKRNRFVSVKYPQLYSSARLDPSAETDRQTISDYIVCLVPFPSNRLPLGIKSDSIRPLTDSPEESYFASPIVKRDETPACLPARWPSPSSIRQSVWVSESESGKLCSALTDGNSMAEGWMNEWMLIDTDE